MFTAIFNLITTPYILQFIINWAIDITYIGKLCFKRLYSVQLQKEDYKKEYKQAEKKEIQKEGEKVDFQEEKDQESLQNTDNTLPS